MKVRTPDTNAVEVVETLVEEEDGRAAVVKLAPRSGDLARLQVSTQ